MQSIDRPPYDVGLVGLGIRFKPHYCSPGTIRNLRSVHNNTQAFVEGIIVEAPVISPFATLSQEPVCVQVHGVEGTNWCYTLDRTYGQHISFFYVGPTTEEILNEYAID